MNQRPEIQRERENEIRNQLAIRFAESNRQDQREYVEEIRHLRLLLMAIINKSGGEIVVQDRDIEALRGGDLRYSIHEHWDERRRGYVLRVE